MGTRQSSSSQTPKRAIYQQFFLQFLPIYLAQISYSIYTHLWTHSVLASQKTDPMKESFLLSY